MTYTAVKEIIVDKNPETMERYKDLVPMFELMAELSEILRERRYKRGTIDFEFPECKIKLNQGGKPISIEPYDRNKATKIIEDFMLAANETIARILIEMLFRLEIAKSLIWKKFHSLQHL